MTLFRYFVLSGALLAVTEGGGFSAKAVDQMQQLAPKITYYENRVKESEDILDLYIIAGEAGKNLLDGLEFENALSEKITPVAFEFLELLIGKKGCEMVGENHYNTLLTLLSQGITFDKIVGQPDLKYYITPLTKEIDEAQDIQSLYFVARDCGAKYGDCCSFEASLNMFGSNSGLTKGQIALIKLLKKRGKALVGKKIFYEIMTGYRDEHNAKANEVEGICTIL